MNTRWVFGRAFIIATLCLFVMAKGVSSAIATPSDSTGSSSAFPSSDLLRDISALVGTEQRVSGTFQQRKHLSVLPQPLRSSGTFRFNQDDGLEWNVQEPIASRLLFNKQGVRQEQDGRAVWEMDAGQPMAIMIGQVLGAVMATDWVVLEQYFAVEGMLDDGQWSMTLTPRDEMLAKVMTRIALHGGQKLHDMTIFEIAGDRTEIDFVFDSVPD